MGTERRAQAMVELAIGLFTAVLVLSAILFFSKIILKSTQNAQEARREAGGVALGAHGADESYSSSVKHASADIGSPLVRKALGRGSVKTEDRVSIPAMGL